MFGWRENIAAAGIFSPDSAIKATEIPNGLEGSRSPRRLIHFAGVGQTLLHSRGNFRSLVRQPADILWPQIAIHD